MLGITLNARFAYLLPEVMLWEGELYLPWQMIAYLTAGLVAQAVVVYRWLSWLASATGHSAWEGDYDDRENNNCIIGLYKEMV